MRTTVTSATVSLLILLAASCGKDNPLDRPDSASGTITAEFAAELASDSSSGGLIAGAGFSTVDGDQAATMASDTDSFNDSLLFANTMGLSSRALKSNSAKPTTDDDEFPCEPTISEGSQTDGDDDGIPARMKASFSCSQSNDLFPYSISGTIDATDADDANKFGGYAVSATDFTMSLTLGEASLNFTLNGKATNTRGTSSFTGVYEQFVSITSSQSNVSGDIGLWLDTVVTPTSMSAVRDAGSIDSMTGFLKARAKSDAQSIDLVLAISSSGLKYNIASCPEASTDHPFTEGSISLKDESNNELKATYTNCEEAWTYNGEAVSETR